MHDSYTFIENPEGMRPTGIDGWNDSIKPVTVASRSEAWNVFARSNAGIVGSNPTQGMDVCVWVYFVFMLSCV
jgi:hypothetical protein